MFAAADSPAESGATSIASPSRIAAPMLQPLARKRTMLPFSKSSETMLAKAALFLTVGICDEVDGFVIGRKAEALARDMLHDALKKAQGLVQYLPVVIGHEAACKKFRASLRGREFLQLIFESMLQQINGGNLRGFGFGKAGITVPGSAVHPEAALFLAHNDAVVAQAGHASTLCPQCCRCTFEIGRASC